MKQNPEFILSDLGNSFLLVPVGAAATEFKGVISLNEMGRLIWELLKDDTTAEAVLAAILRDYDVSEERARADVDSFLATLREKNCIINE